MGEQVRDEYFPDLHGGLISLVHDNGFVYWIHHTSQLEVVCHTMNHHAIVRV